MSILDSHESYLVCALMALAAGCSTEQMPEAEHPSEGVSRHFQDSTLGWDLKWNTFGTSNQDEANDVLIGPNGKVYVAGFENGQFGRTSVEPSGNAWGVIHRFDADDLDRDHFASKYFGQENGSAEVIEALTVAPDATSYDFDLYFAGRTNGAYAGTPGGDYDALLGWVERCGDVHKFQRGSNKPQRPRHIVVNTAGDLIVSGYDDIYVPSNYVDTWEDPFVMKLRRDGDELSAPPMGWPYQASTTNSDVLPGMATTTVLDAPVYVTGTTTSGGGRGMFVKKLLWNGTVAWHAQQSPAGLDSAAALAVMDDGTGNVLFAGGTYVRMGEQSFGEQDVVVRLLSPEGMTLWTKQLGTVDSELVTDMAVDERGNIYLVGETLGTFDEEVPNQGQTDIFVLKLARDGSLLGAFQIGSEGDDHPSSIAVDREGNIFVAGYAGDELFDGGGHRGGRDGFVFRVTPPVVEPLGNQ